MDSLVISRLEGVASRMENILLKYENAVFKDNLSANSSATNGNSTPRLVELLDESIGEKLAKFHSLSGKVGGDVGALGELSEKVFNAHRSFILMACGRKKPENTEFEQLVKDLSSAMGSITDFKERNRVSKAYDHICALEAVVGGFGWVTLPKTPAPFVKDAIDSSLFYINRILMAHKGETDSEWAKLLKDLLTELHKYILKNHTTGLVWNSEPKAATPKASGAPPPPPPPPPPALLTSTSSKSSDVAALLDSLNTGLAATSRLKKVTPEMQTHKTPALRGANGETDNTKKQNKQEVKLSTTQEPRIFWDGKFWKIDYQVGNKNAVLKVQEKKESIYIYKCIDSVIRVDGKANAITLDGCKRTSVVFDGLVAQCEIINSQSIQIQTLGELPTVSIQKTDGCHIYLSREALAAQIVASKSSEMNVLAQLNDDDEEYTEMALPEQFTTSIVGKKLVTVASDIV